MQHRLVDSDARLAEYGLLQKPDFVAALFKHLVLGPRSFLRVRSEELFWDGLGCPTDEPKRCSPGGDRLRSHEQVVYAPDCQSEVQPRQVSREIDAGREWGP